MSLGAGAEEMFRCNLKSERILGQKLGANIALRVAHSPTYVALLAH